MPVFDYQHRPASIVRDLIWTETDGPKTGAGSSKLGSVRYRSESVGAGAAERSYRIFSTYFVVCIKGKQHTKWKKNSLAWKFKTHNILCGTNSCGLNFFYENFVFYTSTCFKFVFVCFNTFPA